MSERIVIVGGGVGGHLVARALQDMAQVVLIDPRDHLWVPMAGPRLLVEPRLAERALVAWTDFLPRVQHVAGRAVAATTEAVTVETSARLQDIPFDHLVLATGARAADDWIVPDGADKAERQRRLEARAAWLARAERVLVIGGGPVGVEVAGELATDLDAQVTLAHGGPELLPGTGLGGAALGWLEQAGVTVHLHTRLDIQADGPFEGTAGDGTDIRADVVLRCTGLRPNTEWLSGLGVLDPEGRVRVRPSLQVRDHDAIWAVGDITDLPERKLAMFAARHADVVARNLRSHLAGSTSTSTTYTPASDDKTLLVTLGREAGVAHLPVVGVVTWPWLLKKLKSQGVFVNKYRKRIGLS